MKLEKDDCDIILNCIYKSMQELKDLHGLFITQAFKEVHYKLEAVFKKIIKIKETL